MGIYRYSSLGGQIPPIPLMAVKLTTPISSELAIDCDAILDTGSDCTLIPIPLLMRVNAKIAGVSIRIPFSGVLTTGVPYKVGLIFDRYTCPEVLIFGCSVYEMGEELIIGRDLLNQYRIEFHGPNETFEIF